MSPVEGFAIVGSVLVSCVPVMRWQIRRARRADAKRDRIASGSNVRPEPDVRPVSETKPGTDVAVQDALELLYSMPAYGKTTTDHTTTEGDL